MITFIKIVFAWKLDNKPSYLRAPAVEFDNSQHLQIYFNTDTPTWCSRLYKTPWLLENSWEPEPLEPYPKTKQTKQDKYSTRHTPNKTVKYFSPKAVQGISSRVNFTLLCDQINWMVWLYHITKINIVPQPLCLKNMIMMWKKSTLNIWFK